MEPTENPNPQQAPTRKRKLSKRERGRRGGKVGGRASVAKGFAKMTPEARRELAMRGVAARKAKKEASGEKA